MSLTVSVLNECKSRERSNVQVLNMDLIVLTQFVVKVDGILNDCNLLHSANIALMSVTIIVLKLDIFKLVNDLQ